MATFQDVDVDAARLGEEQSLEIQRLQARGMNSFKGDVQLKDQNYCVGMLCICKTIFYDIYIIYIYIHIYIYS